MRINKYIAAHTGYSRRFADRLIEEKKVKINGKTANIGDSIEENDELSIDEKVIIPIAKTTTILLNKPVGYVVSRKSQGNPTIYDLLDKKYTLLKPVGRLDKESSGLLVLTNDGDFINRMLHPKYQKLKIYIVKLDHKLTPLHQQMITDFGIRLEDGISKFQIDKLENDSLKVLLKEGKNRQIRRTFDAIGYRVIELKRIKFGDYELGNLKSGEIKEL